MPGSFPNFTYTTTTFSTRFEAENVSNGKSCNIDTTSVERAVDTGTNLEEWLDQIVNGKVQIQNLVGPTDPDGHYIQDGTTCGGEFAYVKGGMMGMGYVINHPKILVNPSNYEIFCALNEIALDRMDECIASLFPGPFEFEYDDGRQRSAYDKRSFWLFCWRPCYDETYGEGNLYTHEKGKLKWWNL
jgi:hypothetical protein